MDVGFWSIWEVLIWSYQLISKVLKNWVLACCIIFKPFFDLSWLWGYFSTAHICFELKCWAGKLQTELSSYFALSIAQQTNLLNALIAKSSWILSLTDNHLLSLIRSASSWMPFLLDNEVDNASLLWELLVFIQEFKARLGKEIRRKCQVEDLCLNC